MKKNEEEVKIKAFGVVNNKIKATFKHSPSVAKLEEPLIQGSGLHAFCRACGTYFEIREEILRELEEILDGEISPQEYFIETSFCPFCDSSEEDLNLRKISELK